MSLIGYRRRQPWTLRGHRRDVCLLREGVSRTPVLHACAENLSEAPKVSNARGDVDSYVVDTKRMINCNVTANLGLSGTWVARRFNSQPTGQQAGRPAAIP